MKKTSVLLASLILVWAHEGVAFTIGIVGESYWRDICRGPVSLPYCESSRPARPPAQPTEPSPAPGQTSPGDSAATSARLTAANATVSSGASTRLSWSSENADRCVASGDWTGTLPSQGSRQVGPLTRPATFTLTCSGPGGNAVSMVAVDVLGRVALKWQPPKKRLDGTPLPGLKGYRIYYGEAPGQYDQVKEIPNPRVRKQVLELPVGEYYFAATAIDAEGNESPRSNEVRKAAR
jgi:hypothetical protein